MNHNCQIFTPTHIVQEMLDLIDYKDNILNKYILDNSCGNGNFLVEIAKRYMSQALKFKREYGNIIKDLEKYIIGTEIDQKLVDECKMKLDDIARSFGIFNVNWNVKCTDGLKYDFKIEFDYIIGNPPYIAYAVLNEEERQYVKKNFKSCSYGKFDYSYAFIEKCLGLLNDNGKMAFITPSNMFKTQFGKNIRELMLPYIIKIIDYSYEKVFDKVLTSPAITVFDKKAKNVILYELKRGGIKVEKKLKKSDIFDKWCFESNASEGQLRFGDYFKVSNSVATLCNKVYVVNNEIVKNYKIEIGAIREAVSPKSKKIGRKEYIIFPYFYKHDKLMRYNEEEYREKFPNAYNYLYNNKELLQSTNKDDQSKWFEFGRSQALAHLNQTKLLISTIVTKEINIYELNETQIPYSGLYIIPIKDKGLEIAKDILKKQSTLLHINNTGIVLSGTSVRISAKDIENLMF